MCPDKVLGKDTITGVYQGAGCEDFCCSTIRLDNGEGLTFLCGEDNAVQFFGQQGPHVRASLELLQFWNELGNECTRQYVCKEGEVVNLPAQAFSFDACMNKAAGVTDSMLHVSSRQRTYGTSG